MSSEARSRVADPALSPEASVDSRRLVIEPTRGLAGLQLGSLWRYRELLYFLIWRDLKVRYRQALLGVAWIALQPIVTVTIFSILFGFLLEVPSGDVPYPAFLYSALLPWNYFATALTKAANSVVNNSHLITKVYFPRLLIPLAGVLAGLVDLVIAFFIFVALMAILGLSPGIAVLMLPLFVILAVLTALAFGLWLGALNVRFRDITYVTPFLIQIWMYLTPVVYGTNLIPEQFRWVMALNPMTGVVEGFRWALLGNHLADAVPPSGLFFGSVAITLLVLVSGLFFFRHTERSFADII